MEDKKKFLLAPERLKRHLESALSMDVSCDKENGQVSLTFNIREHPIPLFFDIRADGELLQLVAYLPFETDESKFGDVARLLHLFNRDLDLPGFGMDERNNLMYYRLMLPCLGKIVDEQALSMYITACKSASEIGINTIEQLNEPET